MASVVAPDLSNRAAFVVPAADPSATTPRFLTVAWCIIAAVSPPLPVPVTAPPVNASVIR